MQWMDKGKDEYPSEWMVQPDRMMILLDYGFLQSGIVAFKLKLAVE